MYVSEIDVKLNRSITVGSGGAMTEVDKILIVGPSVKHRKQAASLKAMFAGPWTAMIEKVQQENKEDVDKAREEKKEKETSGEEKKEGQNPGDFLAVGEVLDSISRFTDKNVGPRDALDVAIGYLKEMMVDGCCKVNGENMKSSMFEKLAYTDVENILGVYVATFLLDSLFA